MGFGTYDRICIANDGVGVTNRVLIVSHDFVFLRLIQLRLISTALINKLHGQTLWIVLAQTTIGLVRAGGEKIAHAMFITKVGEIRRISNKVFTDDIVSFVVGDNRTVIGAGNGLSGQGGFVDRHIFGRAKWRNHQQTRSQ